MMALKDGISKEQIKENINRNKIMDEAMGLLQHHDGVSGTQRQHVADDYSKILSAALELSN